MYVNFYILYETLCFLYEILFFLYKKIKKYDSIRIICNSYSKPPELSSTKMHVFHEIILPFLTFIFPFLLFVKKSDEIIMKMVDFDNKHVVFIIFCRKNFTIIQFYLFFFTCFANLVSQNQIFYTQQTLSSHIG